MEMPPPRPVFHQVGKNYFAGPKVFADAKMIILDANILISLKKSPPNKESPPNYFQNRPSNYCKNMIGQEIYEN